MEPIPLCSLTDNWTDKVWQSLPMKHYSVSHQKESRFFISLTINKPWNYYKWNKPDTIRQIGYKSTYMKYWRRQRQPIPVLLPGKSHGWRSLVGCSPWGRWDQTRLSDFPFTFHFHALEKEMATHFSVLAWRIPGMGELGRLPSMVSQSRTRLKRLSSSSIWNI